MNDRSYSRHYSPRVTNQRRLGEAMSSSVLPRQPGFTQSPEGRWDYGQSISEPLSYGGHSYTSATDALEAYISAYEGRGATQSREVEELLIARCKVHAFGGEDSLTSDPQDSLRRYLAIKRLVDESYDKLGNGLRSSGDTSGSTSSGTLSNGTDMLHSSSGFRGNGLSDVMVDSYGYVRNHAHLSTDHNNDAHLPSHHHHHHHHQLDAISDRLRDDYNYLARNGYHDNLPGASDVQDTRSRRSRFDTDNDRHKRRSLSSDSRLRSGCHGDPDDTLTQLMGSKPSSGFKGSNVPSWVEALDVTDSSRRTSHHNFGNSTIVTGLGHRPLTSDNKAISTPVLNHDADNHLSTPKKQLRFDMDLTRSTLNNSVNGPLVKLTATDPSDVDTEQSEASKRLSTYARHGLILPSQPKSGILKSGQKTGAKTKQHDVSFTTEDIELGTLQYERRRELRGRGDDRKHSRSFSASGRLSSTPIKGGANRERPQISEISSVRTASTAGSVNSDAPSDKYHFLSDRYKPSEDRLRDLSARINLPPPSRKPVSMSPLPRLTPHVSQNAATGAQNNRGAGDLSSSHKDYLRTLVREIDDGSSSVVTGLTELQDLLKPQHTDGIHTPSEASDIPDHSLGSVDDDPDVLAVLNGDRPWERPLGSDDGQHTTTRRTPPTEGPDFHHKKGGIVEKFLKECRVLYSETDEVLNKSGNAPRSSEPQGPMEALKNMLFTMQSMTVPDDLLSTLDNNQGGDAGKTKQDEGKAPPSPSSALSPSTKKLLDTNQGADSLERAMVHLDRLKSMVKGNKEQLK